MTSPLSISTSGTSSTGSVAAARSAATFGPVASASLDQPAVSRRLAYLTGSDRPLSAATSENRGASWVQPTVSGTASPATARKRSSSARQSCCAVVTCAPRQPRRTAPTSSGIVPSHEQIRILPGGLAILLVLSLRSSLV